MAQPTKALKAEKRPTHSQTDTRVPQRTQLRKRKTNEQLSPADARAVLAGAQNSVTVDYSGIDEPKNTGLLLIH